jgi:hypothetical protein
MKLGRLLLDRYDATLSKAFFLELKVCQVPIVTQPHYNSTRVSLALHYKRYLKRYIHRNEALTLITPLTIALAFYPNPTRARLGDHPSHNLIARLSCPQEQESSPRNQRHLHTPSWSLTHARSTNPLSYMRI